MSDRRKKPRMMDDDSDDIITLRLLMNGKEAGTLIGKGGTTISTLRQSSGAIINISDNSTKERIISVTGALESVIKAFKLIGKTLDEAGYKQSCHVLNKALKDSTSGFKVLKRQNLFNNDTSSNSHLLFQLVIPSGQCGSLIGTGGSKIKSIRETSGAFIQIASDTLPMSSERMITISGKQESIYSCVKDICEIMIEYPARGHIVPYYPQNAGRSGGSYYSQRGSEGSTRYSGDNSRRRKRSEDYDDYMSDTMAIPSQFAGSVIGKRGTKINEIRSKSGASVKIADEAEGSKERIVTVSGSPEAVGMAQYLIKTRIEFEEKKANGDA